MQDENYLGFLSRKRDVAAAAYINRKVQSGFTYEQASIEFYMLCLNASVHVRDNQPPGHSAQPYQSFHVLNYSSTTDALSPLQELPGKPIERFFDRVIAGEKPYCISQHPMQPVQRTFPLEPAFKNPRRPSARHNPQQLHLFTSQSSLDS